MCEAIESVRSSGGPRRRRLVSLLVGSLLLLLTAVTGCHTLAQLWGYQGQAAETRKLAAVRGTVETAGPLTGTLVVALTRPPVEPGGPLVGVDTYVRVRPGSFVFWVAPGRYQLGAYEDANRNGLLDPGENVVRNRTNEILEVAAGGEVRQDLVIPVESAPPELTEPINIFDLVARTAEEQRSFSLWQLSAQGKVVDDLDDSRFGPKSGERGVWRVMDFMNDGLAGIYMLEPYDPYRIPVLFVHGIAGHPQQLEMLMRGIDRSRYQAWFYFYPSGYDLSILSSHLATMLERMQIAYDFGEVALVGHSAGGLIARGAALQYRQETDRRDVRLLVSISTPWGGDPRGDSAAKAPIDVPISFKQLSPGSPYLHDLFHLSTDEGEVNRRLAPEVGFHLLFGFRMRARSATASDGSISVASQLRPRAQAQAESQRGFDCDHVEILQDPAVLKRLREVLTERFE